MTATEVIGIIDDLKHNTYKTQDKLRWLAALERNIRLCILENYEDCPADTPFWPDAPLLAEAPYDEMYIHYLSAQMDYHNGEFDRYNNAMAMFQSVYDEFRRAVNRAHTPRGAKFRYF